MVVTEREHMTAGLKHILEILDAGSFVELGGKMIAKASGTCEPNRVIESDGVITGYGTVDGHVVYVFCQDKDVMGGTFGVTHAEKINNIYRLAVRAQAPVVGMFNSTGFRIEEGVDGLNAFASLYKTVLEAKEEVLQIMLVTGECVGSMAMLAEMADFLFIEKKEGKLLVVGEKSKSDEFFTDGNLDDGQYKKIRELIKLLPPASGRLPEQAEVKDDLNRLCVDMEPKKDEAGELLKEISDDRLFIETKVNTGKDIVTGFIKLNGFAVGVVANSYDENRSNRLTSLGMKKASEFIEFCDRFSIAVVTIVNTDGFSIEERNNRFAASSAEEMARALVKSKIPKISLIVGKTVGSAYSLMNSKGLSADMVFIWKGAVVEMMNARQAAQIMFPKDTPVEAERKAMEYEKDGCSAEVLSEHGYADKIISPEESRKYIIGALEAFRNVF